MHNYFCFSFIFVTLQLLTTMTVRSAASHNFVRAEVVVMGSVVLTSPAHPSTHPIHIIPAQTLHTSPKSSLSVHTTPSHTPARSLVLCSVSCIVHPDVYRSTLHTNTRTGCTQSHNTLSHHVPISASQSLTQSISPYIKYQPSILPQ